MLFGLAVDLWWLAGWVSPYDQDFVTLLPASEWHWNMMLAAVSLLGVVTGGFAIEAIVTRSVNGGSQGMPRRPTTAEAVALGIAVIAVPLLVLGIASAAASSALVGPAEVQIQSVWITRGAITLDQLRLRPGPTRFRCDSAPDATPEWARQIARPDGTAGDVIPPFGEDFSACSANAAGTQTWGTIADLRPGRYVWARYAYGEIPVRLITTSPVFVVGP